jgi:quercetin dioxygenase-like cupin family protein
MKRSSDIFCHAESMEWEHLGGGVSRKFLGWDNQIMMVKVRFEKGARGQPHQHFHTQVTYCVEGSFEFTIGDRTEVVHAGSAVYFPPNVVHGAICLDAGVLIDVFSPVREDFLSGVKPDYFGDKEDAS